MRHVSSCLIHGQLGNLDFRTVGKTCSGLLISQTIMTSEVVDRASDRGLPIVRLSVRPFIRLTAGAMVRYLHDLYINIVYKKLIFQL